MAKAKHLSLESLERRDLRAAFGSPWPEPDSLSLSFVPDGTEIGTAKSELQQSLAQVFENSEWQLEVLRAFQTWALETNSNIALSDDEGQPIGTLGFKQGDIRFGDVRIGAFPMESDVLAVANPYDPFIANTWVGDIFLNSNNLFLKNARDPSRALYSIMLHEAGHVFGVGHSDDPASPMFPHFQNRDATLSSNEIGTLRKLYGNRRADHWEGDAGNQTLQDATLISFFDSEGASVSPEWGADLTSLSDVDFYRFVVPEKTKSLDIHFDTQGISLLTAKLTIFNSEGKMLATKSANDPRDNSFQITLRDLEPGEMLYAKVESANSSVFGVGAYEILALPIGESNASSPPAGYAGENEVFFDGEQILATTPGYVEHTYYEVEGSLSLSHPSQTFRVRSSDSAPELENIFTVIVGVENTTIDQLNLTISDAFGNTLPYSIIPSKDGELAIQVVGVDSGADYVISISANDSISSADLASKKIRYEIEVDFAHDGKHLQTILSETLDDSQPSFEQSFTVSESSQFHFALSTSDFSYPDMSGLEMRIINASGSVMASILVIDGSTRTFDVHLDRGNYLVKFSSPNRRSDSTVIFQWSGITTSSPIGPQLRDTIHQPIESKSAIPLISLQNFWSMERLTGGINNPQEPPQLPSSSLINITPTSPHSRDPINSLMPHMTEFMEGSPPHKALSEVQVEKIDRHKHSIVQANHSQSLNSGNEGEQESSKSDWKKSATSPPNLKIDWPPSDEGDTSFEHALTTRFELSDLNEQRSIFAKSIERCLDWFNDHKSRSVSLFFLFLSGIAWGNKRRKSEQLNGRSSLNSLNQDSVNKKLNGP